MVSSRLYLSHEICSHSPLFECRCVVSLHQSFHVYKISFESASLQEEFPCHNVRWLFVHLELESKEIVTH